MTTDGQDEQENQAEQDALQPTLETTEPGAGAPETKLQAQAAAREHALCRAVADALGRALEATGAGIWRVQPPGEPDGPRDAGPANPADHAPDKQEKGSVCFSLRLTGGLGGQCFLTIRKEDVSALAAATGKPAASVLLKAIQGAATELATKLAASYGAVTGTAAKAKAMPADAQPAIRLQASADSGSSASVWLAFDPELRAALADPDGVARALGAALGDEISQENLELVLDVPLQVTLRFGQRQLALREVLDLTSGSVVELDRQVDEPVELILDGRVIARGEAVIVDGNYGVRVTEVLHSVTA
jgi:flagellar motor switch protein FliN/FliY